MVALVNLTLTHDDVTLHTRFTTAMHALYERDPAEFVRLLGVLEDALHTYADTVAGVRAEIAARLEGADR